VLTPKPQLTATHHRAYYFNPATYVLYGTIVTQLGDLHDAMVQVGPALVSIPDFLEQVYSYKYSFRVPLVFILLGFIIFFRVVACLGLSFINFQKR
jgi:hypothetical protein